MSTTKMEEKAAFENKFGFASSQDDIENLAKELHEAGRAAVEQGATVAAGNFGDKARKFLEWNKITGDAREGRRMQARYLLNKYIIRER